MRWGRYHHNIYHTVATAVVAAKSKPYIYVNVAVGRQVACLVRAFVRDHSTRKKLKHGITAKKAPFLNPNLHITCEEGGTRHENCVYGIIQHNVQPPPSLNRNRYAPLSVIIATRSS